MDDSETEEIQKKNSIKSGRESSDQINDGEKNAQSAIEHVGQEKPILMTSTKETSG